MKFAMPKTELGKAVLKCHLGTLLMISLMSIAMSTNAQSDGERSATQVAIDKARADLKDAMRELSSLDDSDKSLARSNRAQSDTTEMLNRSETKIKTIDLPAIQERGRLWDIKRQNVINSGCPADGGIMDPATADRCNSIVRPLNIERARILKDYQNLESRAASIQKTRAAVTKTTVENAQKQKANNARRDDLQTQKLQLMSQVITRSLSLIADKAAATNACQSLPAERAHCCLSVISDGVDPKQCDVELVYNVLDGAGIFQGGAVVPRR
jgi:hypothetical protein